MILEVKIEEQLDKNVDTCLRLYVTKYDIDNFPYERALAFWRSDRERRGASFSNEPNNEHNVLEDHNDNSSREDHVLNVKNKDQNHAWQIDLT